MKFTKIETLRHLKIQNQAYRRLLWYRQQDIIASKLREKYWRDQFLREMNKSIMLVDGHFVKKNS